MTHAEAHALVETNGGEATDHVSRQLTLLVVGEEGWPLEDDGQPSVKLREVLDWQQKGFSIRIINESDFLRIVGLNDALEDVRKLHTPAMLSQWIDVPVHVIRSWERAGLIRPVKRIHRLPYFDFQEVANARRLSELLQAGLSREQIERSLKALPEVIRGDQRPLEQLEVLVRDRKIIIRDAHGLRETRGQRLFEFDDLEEQTDKAESDPVTISFLKARQQALEMEQRDWFVEGCRHADAGELGEAIEAFRLSLMSEPLNAEIHFHLGDVLYRQGRPRAALERYYSAVEIDHDYLEAWTQIGCLHRELIEPYAALDAFSVALDIHEDYPEAHFHRAETLVELERIEEAIPHWQAYLAHEHRGPWADIARQRLKQAGVEDLLSHAGLG